MKNRMIFALSMMVFLISCSSQDVRLKDKPEKYFDYSVSSNERFFLGKRQSDIGILDLKTYKLTEAKHDGLRQVVLHVDNENKRFQTLTRKEGNRNELFIHNYSYEGERLSTTTIPYFAKGFANPTSYAMSADGSKIAYFHRFKNSLCLYDLKTKNEKTLWGNFARTAFNVVDIEWINDKDIVVLTREDDAYGLDNAIVKINIKTGNKQVLYKAVELSVFSIAYSHNKRYLAFLEGEKKKSIKDAIRIYDFAENKVIAALDNYKMIWSLNWNTANDKLVFCEDENIKVFSLSDMTTKTLLKKSPSERSFYPSVLNEPYLIVDQNVGEGDSSYPSALKIYDVNTMKEIARVVGDFNDRQFLIDGGNKLLIEMSY